MGVSLILSSFRRAHLLERSLFSIARQNVPDLEVVVVNDGVEDDTEGVVNYYRDKLDIKYIFSGHRNADGDKWRVSGFALNIGVRVCKHEMIILSCAEIYHLNDAISYLTDAVAKDHKVLASTKIIYFDADGSYFANIKTTESKLSFKKDNEAYDCRLMPFFMGMMKERFTEIGGYDEDFTGYAADDNDLISRLISNGCYYAFTDAEVVHLYHGKRCDSQIHWEEPAWAFNRKLFLERKNIIIRNQNREWGKI